MGAGVGLSVGAGVGTGVGSGVGAGVGLPVAVEYIHVAFVIKKRNVKIQKNRSRCFSIQETLKKSGYKKQKQTTQHTM